MIAFIVYSAVVSYPYHPVGTQIPGTRGRISLCVQRSSEDKTQPTYWKEWRKRRKRARCGVSRYLLMSAAKEQFKRCFMYGNI